MLNVLKFREIKRSEYVIFNPSFDKQRSCDYVYEFLMLLVNLICNL